VSDLLRRRNEWSVEMRGRERVESKATLEAERGRDMRSTSKAPQVKTHTHTHTHAHTHTHTHKAEGLCNVSLLA
jgi:hypothetical protein